MARRVKWNHHPKEIREPHAVGPDGTVLSNGKKSEPSKADLWTRGVVPVERDDGVHSAKGWIHRSGWVGLFRIFQDAETNADLHPFAMVHIPTGGNLRLHPSLEIAGVIAEYLTSYDTFCREAPIQILPGYFTGDIEVFMAEHKLFEWEYEFITKHSSDAPNRRVDTVKPVITRGTSSKSFNSWEPEW